MISNFLIWLRNQWEAVKESFAATPKTTKVITSTCIIILAGGCFLVSFRGYAMRRKSSLIGEGSTYIQSTCINVEQESQDAQKIGTVEHLEQPEVKILTSRYIESERIKQKENPRSFVQEVRTDFSDFLEEIRKKRIERTGVTAEYDFWNDVMEIIYWVSNLPPSPRYGIWFALGDKFVFPFFEKDKFFERYYPRTYHYRIKNGKDPSNLDPRKIWPSGDSFSQEVLPLKAEFQPPIEIRLCPKDWSKIQQGRGESL